MTRSGRIADFLDLLDEVVKEHERVYELVGIEDDRQNDLLHSIEFCDDEEKLTEVAKKLHKCREDRRALKDIEIETSIIKWWIDRNEVGISYLRETLSRVQRCEEHIKTRTYNPRVEDEV